MKVPTIIKLPTVQDLRGSLSFVESDIHVPFSIRRVYFIHDVPSGESRGSHAHKQLQQLFIAISGSFFIELDDGKEYKESFYLSKPSEGLFVPGGYWRLLDRFSSNSTCMVLASEPYSSEEYIRNYDDFLAYKMNF